jgi:hypothetical protein
VVDVLTRAHRGPPANFFAFLLQHAGCTAGSWEKTLDAVKSASPRLAITLGQWMAPGDCGTTVILLDMRDGIFDFARRGHDADAVLLATLGSAMLHQGNKCRERSDRGKVPMDHSLRSFLELIFLHGAPLGGNDNVSMTLFGEPVKRFNWLTDLKQQSDAGTKVEFITWDFGDG